MTEKGRQGAREESESGGVRRDLWTLCSVYIVVVGYPATWWNHYRPAQPCVIIYICGPLCKKCNRYSLKSVLFDFFDFWNQPLSATFIKLEPACSEPLCNVKPTLQNCSVKSIILHRFMSCASRSSSQWDPPKELGCIVRSHSIAKFSSSTWKQ